MYSWEIWGIVGLRVLMWSMDLHFFFNNINFGMAGSVSDSIFFVNSVCFFECEEILCSRWANGISFIFLSCSETYRYFDLPFCIPGLH